MILLPIAILFLLIELFRLQNKTFKRIFFNMFGLILRKHEHNDFTGATYLIISSLFSIAIFSPKIAFIALSFLAIGDTVAAIVGKSQGKRQFLRTPKSLEGSLACFVATFSFAIFFIHPVLAFFGAITATVAEATEIPLDDNIKIPVMSGIVMQLLLFFM